MTVRNEASGMNETYSITAAGVEEFGLFPDYLESLRQRNRPRTPQR